MRSSSNFWVKFAYDKGYRVLENGTLVSFTGEILKGSVNHNGYLRFTIRNGEGQRRDVTVHSLQAYQKFGDKLFNKDTVVRHLDNDKLNNSFSNVEIGSQQQNMLDLPIETRARITKTATEASRRVTRKLTESQLVELRARKAAGESIYRLAKDYKLASSTVSYIVNNKTYKTTLTGVKD